jgi:hypothetical protein
VTARPWRNLHVLLSTPASDREGATSPQKVSWLVRSRSPATASVVPSDFCVESQATAGGKLRLVLRYEKLERSFIALNHIAAAIIAFRKVSLSINIIYG